MAHHIITPVSETDWEKLTEVQFRAFAEEPFFALTAGENSGENRARVKEKHVGHRKEHPDTIWMKVIDADDPHKTILGAARYVVASSTTPPVSKTIDPNTFVWLDQSEDREIGAFMLEDVIARSSRLISEPHVRLDYLFVDPEYRGLGIGGSLVKWGTDLADHVMLPFWLESSTKAHGVYLRYGFEDKIHCRQVMGKWDIEYFIMKRTPKATYTETQQLCNSTERVLN